MSSTSCLLCRSRKIKCDRVEPHCQNCSRLGVTCPGYAPNHGGLSPGNMRFSPEAIYRASGIEKRRLGSCDACRLSKIRCTKTRPTCERCLQRGTECTYNTMSITSRATNAADASSDVATLQSPATTVSPEPPLLEDPALRSRFLAAYFESVHPLRCLAFIHKPSFMYALDRDNLAQEYDDALVDAMCALGARILCLDSSNDSYRSFCSIGQALSDRAHSKIMARLGTPTVQQLMTTVLLCEYVSRTNRHAVAFVLVGCLHRQLRLLGLDTPSNNVDPAHFMKRETQNRLVWACFSLDVLLASGVDKNSSWQENHPSIPLPCSNSAFLSQTSTRPPTLEYCIDNPVIMTELDLPALNVILTYLRTKVLRLIRATNLVGDIWDPSSPFMVSLHQLELFYNNLPEKYALSDLNSYLLKDQHTLGAVVFLHLLYHAALCDLCRISLPGFDFPLAAALQNAPPAFVTQCQQRCQFHADFISQVIRKSLPHGRMAFDDPFVADATFESTKIQIVYSATISRGQNAMKDTLENIKTNLALLQTLNSNESEPSHYIRALRPLCSAFGFREVAREWQQEEGNHGAEAEVVGSAEVHHLSNMAPFRRARTETRARQGNNNPQQMTMDTAEPGNIPRRPPTIFANICSTQEAQPSLPSPYASLDYPDVHSAQNVNPQASGLYTPMSDYTRTAEAMSQFLTWDVVEWWNLPMQDDF